MLPDIVCGELLQSCEFCAGEFIMALVVTELTWQAVNLLELFIHRQWLRLRWENLGNLGASGIEGSTEGILGGMSSFILLGRTRRSID